MVTDTERYQRILAKDRRYDGRFLTGVLTTGIYCLPSCPARKPKRDNVRFYTDEASAQAAGLRPCLRCRPDLFYRGIDSDEAIYEGLQARLQQAEPPLADVAALARQAGVARTKLVSLCREHGHTSPAKLLLRERLARVARQLLTETTTIKDLAYQAGFNSERTLHRQFQAHYRLSPGAYRAMAADAGFTLQLPPGYRQAEVLAYLGRDAGGPAERRDGDTLTKALLLAGQPVRLHWQFGAAAVLCRLDSPQPLTPAVWAAAHHASLRCLGLWQPPAAQAGDAEGERLLRVRPGLQLPLTGTVWEALVWAIVGQQVNLTFAAKLRRVVINLAGQPAGEGMLAHPDPAAVAALDSALLGQHQFSRSKADYLVSTARHLVEHGIDIETLSQQSAPAALRRLIALRGIGPWTAQYVLLRGAGFADCVPVGDAGLVAALQRFFKLPARPDATQTQQLMAHFAPWRSLATALMWASLKDEQP